MVFISLLAAGFIFLPQVVGLFAGQHYWYDLEGEQNILSSDIGCEKCHADVAEEMNSHVGPHTGETGYGRMECAQCHRVKLGTYQFAAIGNDSKVFPGGYAHAAATVACMDCHQYVTKNEFDTYTVGENHAAYKKGKNDYWFQKCERCHGKGGGKQIPPAGGFGLTNGTGDSGSSAAHMNFIISSVNNSLLKEENEACIGCHTAAPVKINWSHASDLEFEVVFGEFKTSKWNVTGWRANGTTNVTIWGNTSGGGTTDGENWPGNIDDTYTFN